MDYLPIIELYQILGCDLTVIPDEKYSAFVLGLKFLAVTGFLFLGAKYLYRLMTGMWR